MKPKSKTQTMSLGKKGKAKKGGLAKALALPAKGYGKG